MKLTDNVGIVGTDGTMSHGNRVYKYSGATPPPPHKGDNKWLCIPLYIGLVLMVYSSCL